MIPAEPVPEKPGAIVISLADKRAGRGAELVAKARELGVELIVEQYESPAGAEIRRYCEANPRDQLIERLKAQSRRR
jgi:hypothetical protein